MAHGRPGRPRKDGSDKPEAEVRRRRRKSSFSGNNQRLPVPEIKGFHARWVTDESTRIHDFTVLDDWDFVEKSEIKVHGRVDVGDPVINSTIDPGERVSIPVGMGGGVVKRQYLLKKKLEYFQADRDEKRDTRNAKRKAQMDHPKIDHRTGKIVIT